MSVLRDRILAPPPMGDYHPHGTPDTPMVMPLARVTYDGTTATATYDTMHPLWAADGSPYPATREGSYGQVVPAGRP